MKPGIKKYLSSALAIVVALAFTVCTFEVAIMFGGSPVTAKVLAIGSDGDGGGNDNGGGSDSGSGSGSGSGGGSSAPVKKTKKSNPMTVKGKTINVKYTSLKKKTKKFKSSKAVKVRKAQGKVTYSKKSGNKKIKVSKSGTFTVKKGLKAGTYKVKVKVRAAGNSNYKPASKTVTVKVKVGKGANTLKVTGKNVTVKGDDLVAGNVVIPRANVITVKSAKGSVSYALDNADAAGITVNSKGDVTVPKGLAEGSYGVDVDVTAAGTKNYAKGTESAVFTITVTAVTPVEPPQSEETPPAETPPSETVE